MRSSDSSRQLTTNTRSFQTIGEACPVPGISTFQAMFWPLGPFQCSGRFFSRLLPSPRGPRQQGQFSASARREDHDPNKISKDTADRDRADRIFLLTAIT